MPSVRGRERGVVGAILAASSAATGALVGFAGAVVLGSVVSLAGWSFASFETAATLVVIGALADLVRLSFGRPKPLALSSQVPMEWGRMFSAPVVALLYGARLGVGPLTMLSTWLWWSTWLAAALISPVAGALTGATFGLVRVLVMAAITPPVTRLRTWTRPSWLALDVGAMVGVAVLALVVAGCSRTGEVSLEPVDRSADPDVVEARDAAEANEADQESEPVNSEPEDSESGESETVVTTPSAIEPGDITVPNAAEEEPGVASSPDGLASVLIPEVRWFNRLDGPGADEFLDIDAAAGRQPDPSEELPLLETRRFQGGWTRAFRNDTQDVVIAQVYEFETPSAAAFYLEDGLITLGGYGVDFFDLEAMPGVRGFRQESADEIGPVINFGLTFTVGRRWYLLTLTGDPATATLDILVGAAEAQLALAQ